MSWLAGFLEGKGNFSFELIDNDLGRYGYVISFRLEIVITDDEQFTKLFSLFLENGYNPLYYNTERGFRIVIVKRKDLWKILHLLEENSIAPSNKELIWLKGLRLKLEEKLRSRVRMEKFLEEIDNAK